jgi:vacuolar-type H+-ATPase subunit D/Vma8
MGFFKSMRELKQISKEIEKTAPPVGQRLAEAQAKMANASQMMAAQTHEANAAMAAAASGVDMAATITGMRQVGTVNFNPMMEFDLTVIPSGLPPYPATVRQTINQMQMVQVRPGASVHVKVDPNNPSALWLDPTSIR